MDTEYEYHPTLEGMVISRAWWTGASVASARPACGGKVASLTSVRDSSGSDPGQVIYYQAVSFDTGHTEQ